MASEFLQYYDSKLQQYLHMPRKGHTVWEVAPATASMAMFLQIYTGTSPVQRRLSVAVELCDVACS